MYLTKYIERMGTGIRDMIRRCRAAGLAEPEIRIDGSFFVLTIRRKMDESGAQSEAILKNLEKEPLSAAELAVALDLQSKTGAFKRILQELIDSKMIEYTSPTNPPAASRNTDSRRKDASCWNSWTRRVADHERS